MISNKAILDDAANENEVVIIDGKEYVKVKVRMYEIDVNKADEFSDADALIQKLKSENEFLKSQLEKSKSLNHDNQQLSVYYKKELDGLVKKYIELKELSKNNVANRETEALKIKSLNKEINELRSTLNRFKKKQIMLDCADMVEEVKAEYKKLLLEKNSQYKDTVNRLTETKRLAYESKMTKYTEGLEIKWTKNKEHFRNNLCQMLENIKGRLLSICQDLEHTSPQESVMHKYHSIRTEILLLSEEVANIDIKDIIK